MAIQFELNGKTQTVDVPGSMPPGGAGAAGSGEGRGGGAGGGQ